MNDEGDPQAADHRPLHRTSNQEVRTVALAEVIQILAEAYASARPEDVERS
jgi:hypothetical protein